MGWGAVFSLAVTFDAAFAAERLDRVLLVSALNVVPLILCTAVLGYYRGRLLRPEWPLRRTLVVHGGVALTFGIVLSLMMLGVMQITGLSSAQSENMSGWARFLFGVVNAVFIYVVFVAFLMWSESVRRVHESQAAVAHAAALRSEAEAKAIRAQFNPHFVFNTLHSLMLLVRADPAAAERAIEDVATLIRYASIVQRRDLDVVPVSKECEVSRRYIALEQLRLGDRLRTSWDVADDVGELMIPAFALQTLVENAVKHGIEPQPSGGTIHIGLRRVEGTLEVLVRDDGRGSEPGEVLEAGHGLELLRRRLASRSGAEASLTWETAPGEGFQVAVRVPAEIAPADPELAVIPERNESADLGTPSGGFRVGS